MKAWNVVLGLGCAPGVAAASDVSLNAGVVDLVSTDAKHVGAYPYLGASLIVPTEHVTLVPTLGIEWSPELGGWGLTAALVVDIPVAKRLGLDIIASLVHDQPGDEWSSAAFYAGLGLGVSVFREQWTVSPSVSVLRGLDVEGWTLAPAVNVSYAF
jgi:hypothetical protein